MTIEGRRQLENIMLSTRLCDIHGREELHFLGSMIQDHDHFRDVLMSESDIYERRAKHDAIAPYCRFKSKGVRFYEEDARAKGKGGVQPFEYEKAITEGKQYAPSYVHEVRG